MSCKFHFLNVGYGSCTIIECIATLSPECNEKIIVVDCKKGDKRLNEDNLTDYIKTSEIELLIITHPHKDHIDGVFEIFEKNIEIKKVWITPFEIRKEDINADPESCNDYFRLIGVMNDYGIPIEKISRSKSSLYNPENIPGLEIFVLNPPDNINQIKGRMFHDGCLVLKVNTPDITAIFGSDARDFTWRIIEDYAGHLLKSDIFNVSHHGATDALDKKVFEKIDPKYIILSTKPNIYDGIPDELTIEYYKDFKEGKLLRTDEAGTIIIG